MPQSSSFSLGVNAYSRRELLCGAAAGLVTMSSASAIAQALANDALPSERQSRPNFLFVVADQHRHDYLGCAGEVPVRTPNLDALAVNGVRFTQAYCASPVCGPSRACLASGMEYEQCRVPDHKVNYPIDQVTYYSLLRDAGYHVMGCGKFDLHKKTHDWGVDGQHLLKQWGFSAGIDSAGKWDALKDGAVENPRDPYMAYLKERGLAQAHQQDMRGRGQYQGTNPTPLDDEAYCDNWIGRQALRLIKESPAGKPWHLQINFAGPHEPMDVTASMHDWYRKPAVDFPLPFEADGNTQPQQHQQVRRNYAAMIQNIDRWVGLLVETLKSRGQLENTIIVYSSDHGEMLGDHGRWEKHCPYESSVRVPLIVAGRQVRPAGQGNEALVSLIDVGATFLDYAGVQRPAAMQSRSLRPILSGETQANRGELRSGLGPWRALRDGRHKLIQGFYASMSNKVIMGNAKPAASGQPMLFDLAEDPRESRNLAADRPDLVRAFSARIGAEMGT